MKPEGKENLQKAMYMLKSADENMFRMGRLCLREWMREANEEFSKEERMEKLTEKKTKTWFIQVKSSQEQALE